MFDPDAVLFRRDVLKLSEILADCLLGEYYLKGLRAQLQADLARAVKGGKWATTFRDEGRTDEAWALHNGFDWKYLPDISHSADFLGLPPSILNPIQSGKRWSEAIHACNMALASRLVDGSLCRKLTTDESIISKLDPYRPDVLQGLDPAAPRPPPEPGELAASPPSPSPQASVLVVRAIM